MAKSGSSQNSKKKRDKRRLLKQQALPVRQAWQDVDVSAWLDNTVGFEADILDVIYPKADDLPSPVYDLSLPGDYCFSYYACTHPDKKEEAEAVCLVKKLLLFQKNSAGKDDGKDGEEDGAEAGTAKDLLDKLKKMAREGCVTASAYLGHMYVHGKLVRRNVKKGQELLRFAADNNDPVACFWLAVSLDEAEGTKLMQKSCESCCPSALFIRLRSIGHGDVSATSSEIDMLAMNLAALASNGCMKSLMGLLSFLSTDYGEELRREYAPAMLGILDGLAAEGYGVAVHYQAVTYTQGVLRPADANKAAELYLKAHALGEEQAGLLYAVHMLRHASDSDMPRQQKIEKAQPARKMLEDLYSKGSDMPRSAGILGCILVMSDDDDDFRKGIRCLEEALAGGDLGTPLRAADNILRWSDDPERHKLCLRLLNSLVRKKAPLAFFLRGRYYLDGGLAGNQNIAKGLEMLEKAAALGVREACLLLAEVYLFRLYDCETDLGKAAELLKQGSKLKSRQCKVLHALMQLGEFPDCPASVDSTTAVEVLRTIKDNHTRDDHYLFVTYALAHLNAESQFRKYGEGSEFSLKKLSRQQEHTMAVGFAERCNEILLKGILGPLCYAAYAMEKIGRTKSAAMYAEVLASHLHLPEDSSCEDIADFLYDYVDSGPQGYVDYRLRYSRNAADEKRPLY